MQRDCLPFNKTNPTPDIYLLCSHTSSYREGRLNKESYTNLDERQWGRSLMWIEYYIWDSGVYVRPVTMNSGMVTHQSNIYRYENIYNSKGKQRRVCHREARSEDRFPTARWREDHTNVELTWHRTRSLYCSQQGVHRWDFTPEVRLH